MSAMLIVLLVLVVAASIGLVVSVRLNKVRGRDLRGLQEEQEDIVGTERRMFGYLHDLSVAIAGEQREATLYRLIVEGAVKVTASAGGAFYVFDEAANAMVPRHVSSDCTPLITLPGSASTQQPGGLLSQLRLQRVSADDSMLGDVLADQTARMVKNLPGYSGHTALVGPVTSGKKRLGVLAVTLPPGEQQYDANDMEIFSALAEQSAFALASAAAHVEMAQKRKLEQELSYASEVQRVLLPDSQPKLNGFSIFGRNRAAKILSGDFFDYVVPDPNRFGVIIADVSGKGFPAALIAATCRSSVRAHAIAQSSPSSVLSAVNRQIFDDINEDMFVSAIYLILEEGGDMIRLARAGHPNPFLWRKATGEVEEITAGGLGLGIDEGEVFDRVSKDAVIQLQPGDCLLTYTDGVTEAENAEGEEFGEDRLRQMLAKLAGDGPATLVNAIVAAVDEFCGRISPADDITLVAIQRQ
ncbi:MAG: serine/threonine-protein phosphatase [Verrucomicrobiaceae bacterium]|nr:serine/threonine-protein phosphatase [Verrucomicrobiaceae bacterium]